MNLLIQFLTYFRIVSAPLIYFLIVSHLFGWAFVLTLLASFSDFWDGYLARKYNLESVIGSILDPIADKILVTFLILALAVSMSSSYIAFIGGMILVREFWVAALRDINARENNLDATKVTLLAKSKTFIQLSTFLIYILGLYFNSALLIFVGNFLLFTSLIITLQTGLEYTVSTFKTLKK